MVPIASADFPDFSIRVHDCSTFYEYKAKLKLPGLCDAASAEDSVIEKANPEKWNRICIKTNE